MSQTVYFENVHDLRFVFQTVSGSCFSYVLDIFSQSYYVKNNTYVYPRRVSCFLWICGNLMTQLSAHRANRSNARKTRNRHHQKQCVLSPRRNESESFYVRHFGVSTCLILNVSSLTLMFTDRLYAFRIWIEKHLERCEPSRVIALGNGQLIDGRYFYLPVLSE